MRATKAGALGERGGQPRQEVLRGEEGRGGKKEGMKTMALRTIN